MLQRFLILAALAGLQFSSAADPDRSVPTRWSYAHAVLKPAPLQSVKLTDGFWKPRIDTSISPSLLGGVTVLRGAAIAVDGGRTQSVKLTAIPYVLWDNRGWSEMQVWLPREASRAAR